MRALLRPRGIFVKLSATVPLLAILVLIPFVLLELAYAPARFEAEAKEVMLQLQQQSQNRLAEQFDSCQSVADQLWRELLLTASNQVTNFAETIELALSDHSVVRIAGAAGAICQSGTTVSSMLGDGLRAAETAGSLLYSQRQAGDQIVIARLQLTDIPPRYALAGLHFSRSSLLKPATFYEYLHTLVVFIALGVSVAGVAVFVVIRRVRRAARVAQYWAEGDMTVRIRDRAGDEISDLTAHFDRMAMTLEQAMQENRELAVRVERDRIARDLHDSVKQRTFVLGVKLAELDIRLKPMQGAQVRLLLSDARSLLDHVQDDLSRLLRDGPGTTVVGDLRAKIENDLAGLLGEGVSTTIDLPESVATKILAHPRIAEELMVITLESAANAARHSNCSVFTLRVSEDEAIHWHIEDNGKGFDPTRRFPGMGLGNLRWRAESLPGGVLRIHSDPTGTRIEVMFTLAGQGNAA
ncbi:MAG: HAMP domain-containing protein [Rhodanobacteraceae bacterium]|nr:HAMP domain-containing protein [Rhodanobacteraceae bacterium]